MEEDNPEVLDEFQKLLDDLKVEPADGNELEAKFTLYEKYLETVEAIRSETFAFYESSKGSFTQLSVRRNIEGSLIKVDGRENMSLHFSSTRWFVYDMVLKASKNRLKIQNILKDIGTKLQLLSTQDDCPICLEKYGAERDPVVLSCCHKVCQVTVYLPGCSVSNNHSA